MGQKQHHPLKRFRWRHEPPLTQTEAAERFGVSQAQWSRWENGLQRPSRELAKELMRKTGVSLEVLMGMAS